MKIDKEFETYFNGRLYQVFLYITDLCQLRCEQCLYKTTLAQREMDLDIALKMLKLYRQYGATKLTLIGGEPTLFDIKNRNKGLFKVLDVAKDLGYKYIRLDTNGQFKADLLNNSSFKKIDNLSFSIDGHNDESNDILRGVGTFNKSMIKIKEAVILGYYTTITACIHPQNIDYIDEMIEVATELGVKEFNMHPLFKMGIERDNFSGEAHIDPAKWMGIYNKTRKNIEQQKYKIHVRVPQRFINKSQYIKSPDMYNYCPVKMGERILVHPDGKIRICALCIGSEFHIASYNKDQIRFGALNSEISPERLKAKPCMSQTKDFDNLTPLCISYKPFQKEHVWVTQEFDKKFLGEGESTYNTQ